MTARRTASTLAAAVAAATLLLTGCSGGPGGASDGGLTYEDSPLTKYLEPVNGTWDEERAVAESKEVEEIVAACMADEGFDYTPVDQSQNMSFEDDWEERQTEEWVASNGWGMVQTPEEMEAQQEDAEEFVDPNQPYLESLSPSEQEAYYATLYGPGPSEEELNEDGSYEYNWEEAGCQGAAQHEVQGDTNYWEDDEFADLVAAMTSLWEELPKQPEVAELNEKWSACMADAEYPDFAERAEAQNSIIEQLNAFWEGENPTEPSADELKALKQQEIDIALADFRCAKELDYDNVEFTAQFDLEDQFIVDHKSELDALLAAYDKGE
ncbi:hypothetical protein [Agromyces humatus]|uniref:Uncharacterized protein n=1 Tax=Agromyces humatus TaxID=279573 RepID=A0ABP4WEN7_9MICO|nr:hypothetical protein [Agromyces humatus]